MWGLKGALIASPSVYAGLAKSVGLDFEQVSDTSSPGDDLRERIDFALSDPEHDFFHVHTKVPDEAVHKGNASGKRDAIALLDRGFDRLVETLEKRDDLVVAIAADHSTPSGRTVLIHSGEPVPVAICGPKVRMDNVRKYDEIEAAAGCLGMSRGRELVAMLLNYADRSNLASLRLGPEERLHVSLDYRPFRRK
jgi:2,3-bisphosphoglycerate-independent phosphoglycerate mutase